MNFPLHRRLVACLFLFLTPLWGQIQPDPCVDTLLDDIVRVQYSGDLTQPGAVIHKVHHNPPYYNPHELPAKLFQGNRVLYFPDFEVFDPQTPVVLFIHGQGFNQASHDHLLQHLARNGFICQTWKRGDTDPGGELPDPMALITEVKTYFSLDQDTPVIVIGHSYGGKMATNLAEENQNAGAPHNIRALVGISPTSEAGLHLTPTEAPNYLVLLGSRDQDTYGWETEPPGATEARAGFAAYDRAGTEGSTDVIFVPPGGSAVRQLKAMVFLYGMDHDGSSNFQQQCNSGTQYLDYDDMRCFTRAYVTGFLRWRIYGEDDHGGMFAGDWKPQSVLTATTAAADGWGNAAGAPLGIYQQYSATYRRALVNFSTTPTIYKSSGINYSIGPALDIDDWAPHDTRLMKVTWSFAANARYLWIPIPSYQQNLTGFDTFSLRVGQAYNAWWLLNPFNQEQEFNIWLLDENFSGTSMPAHLWGEIPFPDDSEFIGVALPCESNGDQSKSAMSTVRIPLSSWSRHMNLSKVIYMGIELPANSFGTLLFDNFEVSRDDY